MIRKTLALMLAVLFMILPLQTLAITESEWNEGCRFKTTKETTLYTRDQETNQFTPLADAANPVLPANSYISVVSTEVDGKRQISFFRDGNAQYAWIDKDTYTWAVVSVDINGTKISLPELSWGNEEAIRKYMRSFYSEEQIQAVLAAMVTNSGVSDNSTPAPVVPSVTEAPATQAPAAQVTATPAPAADTSSVAETVSQPVAVTAAPATSTSAGAPSASVTGLIPAGTAPTPFPETAFMTISYFQNGEFQGVAQLVRLGAVSSLISIGGTAYKIDTDDIEWETNAEQGTRLAAVSNIEMSSAWLREKGDLDGKRLANVPAGAVVAVLDNVNGENYTRVYYAGRIGFISNGLLVYSDGEDPIAHGVLSVDGSTAGTAQISVWVHPTTASFQVGKWNVGTVVDVLEYNDDWIRVEVDGFQGWVNSKYINLQ